MRFFTRKRRKVGISASGDGAKPTAPDTKLDAKATGAEEEIDTSIDKIIADDRTNKLIVIFRSRF